GGLVLLGAAIGAKGAVARAALPPLPERPNVLVYLVDALRRDALGCYGRGGGISPHFDRLAAEGTLFRDAIAHASWTRPAVASLFTGLTPAGHGVHGRDDALAEDALTVAERFRDGGWRTASFLANPNVSGRLGFRQGFEHQR